MASKQVIVMKKFKGLRTGKYCAQASHASLGAFLSLADKQEDKFVIPLDNPFVKEWLLGKFRKITVYVETDKELIDIYNAARAASIATAIIVDSGLTEFNGIPTMTAVGIGPDDEEKINKITGHLPLF
jgi:PTH2 family peptidyl-tRNA hydrolase